MENERERGGGSRKEDPGKMIGEREGKKEKRRKSKEEIEGEECEEKEAGV